MTFEWTYIVLAWSVVRALPCIAWHCQVLPCIARHCQALFGINNNNLFIIIYHDRRKTIQKRHCKYQYNRQMGK